MRGEVDPCMRGEVVPCMRGEVVPCTRGEVDPCALGCFNLLGVTEAGTGVRAGEVGFSEVGADGRVCGCCVVGVEVDSGTRSGGICFGAEEDLRLPLLVDEIVLVDDGVVAVVVMAADMVVVVVVVEGILVAVVGVDEGAVLGIEVAVEIVGLLLVEVATGGGIKPNGAGKEDGGGVSGVGCSDINRVTGANEDKTGAI